VDQVDPIFRSVKFSKTETEKVVNPEISRCKFNPLEFWWKTDESIESQEKDKCDIKTPIRKRTRNKRTRRIQSETK